MDNCLDDTSMGVDIISKMLFWCFIQTTIPALFNVSFLSGQDSNHIMHHKNKNLFISVTYTMWFKHILTKLIQYQLGKDMAYLNISHNYDQTSLMVSNKKYLDNIVKYISFKRILNFFLYIYVKHCVFIFKEKNRRYSLYLC